MLVPYRLTAAMLLLFPVLVMAQESPVDQSAIEEEVSPWSGELALGYLSSAGNAESTSASGRVFLAYKKTNWEAWGEFKGFGASDDTGTTAETYEGLGRALRNLDPNNYLYAQLEWRKNRFGAYTEQAFETVGYGRRVLDSELFKLNFEVGAGATQQDFVVSTEPTVTEEQDGAVFTGGAEFGWQIGPTSRFEQLANVNASPDNTFWESITRLRLDIVSALALSIEYTIQGNTEVDADREKTDRYTSISLNYAF